MLIAQEAHTAGSKKHPHPLPRVVGSGIQST
jgi:hypothetical protein